MVKYSFGYRVRRVHRYPHIRTWERKKTAVICWERQTLGTLGNNLQYVPAYCTR